MLFINQVIIMATNPAIQQLVLQVLTPIAGVSGGIAVILAVTNLAMGMFAKTQEAKKKVWENTAWPLFIALLISVITGIGIAGIFAFLG